MSDRTPPGFRNTSTTTVEKYTTEDGNVIIQRISARSWVVLPRGTATHPNEYTSSKGAAVARALTLAADITAKESAEVKP